MNISLPPLAPENLVTRDGFGSPDPRQPAHLHTQAESGTYGIPPDFRGGVHLYIFKPPYAIGLVPSLSGHVIAYQWRSLPRVRRHRASKPQGSSKRVLPWQVALDQLICASLSHTHYWCRDTARSFFVWKCPSWCICLYNMTELKQCSDTCMR